MSNPNISNSARNNLVSKQVIYLSPIYRFFSLLLYICILALFFVIIYVDFILASIPIGLIFLFLTFRFSHFIWNTKPQITLSEKGMMIHFEDDKLYPWQDINNEEIICHSTASNYFKYDLIFQDRNANKHSYRISPYDISPADFGDLVSEYKTKFRSNN